MHKRKEVLFHNLLSTVRKDKKVIQEQLCEGICSVSMLARIEDGERSPDKMMRDRLMERLGVTNDGYEDFLQLDEYESWKKRQELIQVIESRNFTAAQSLIDQYKEEATEENKIERQFYLAMQGQLWQFQNKTQRELWEIYEKALCCTVEKTDFKDWENCIFSIQEWNLILESVYFEENPLSYKACVYEAIMKVLQNSVMDEYCLVKIYPKAAYYYCRLLQIKEEKSVCERILNTCNTAIEMLRSTRRMYYLYELLEIREAVLDQMKDEPSLKQLKQDTLEWKKILSELYRQNDVSERMENFCYLYWQTETYSIGDVVRTRRKMLGMTREELCRDICDKKTLQRLETNRTKTQAAIVRELFVRLGLSPEYQRQQIITDHYDALVLYRAIAKAELNNNIEEMDYKLDELKNRINMEDPNNRQEIERIDSLIKFLAGRITREQLVEQLKEALEYTISLKKIQNDKEKYFTCGEISCIYNIAMRGKMEDTPFYIKLLQDIYAQYTAKNGIGEYISMYIFVMIGIASYWGNKGEYETSNRISDTVLRESLMKRRIGMLHNCLYNNWWNQMECMKHPLSQEDIAKAKSELQRCIALSRFCKENKYEDHYCNKLRELENGEVILA